MDTIKPIIRIKPAQCKICKGPLRIIESEQNEIMVDEYGIPYSEESLYAKLIGYCPSCKKQYPMVKKNMYYVQDIEAFTKASDYISTDSKVVKGIKEKNPFVKAFMDGLRKGDKKDEHD